MAKRGGIINGKFWWHTCRHGIYRATEEPDCKYCTATRKEFEDAEKVEKEDNNG